MMERTLGVLIVTYLATLMFIAAFLVASLFVRPAHAGDLSNDINVYVAEGAYQSLALVDMATTLDIRRHPGDYEQNPIMGRHPSDAKVIGYFAIEDAAHALITRALVSNGWTKTAYTWEALSIGVEAGCIAHNYHLGLTARF
jgi:hypothetical protein